MPFRRKPCILSVMEHLRCVVETITYQNQENGYTVIKCRAKNFQDFVTVVGTMPEEMGYK